MRNLFLTIAGLALIGGGLGIWAFLIEPGWVRYREYEIAPREWPENLSGFTIAFIADTHVGSPHISLEKMKAIVAETNARKPDLVLLGGDYVIQGVIGGTPVPSAEIASVLAGLEARYGVYAVMGNHDWWENAPRMTQEFEERGIRVLEDAAQLIKFGESEIWLAGISDYTEGAHDVDGALASVDTTRPLIVVTHSPDIFPDIPDRALLALTGHTHGGQVYVPFLGRPVVPSKYGQRYALGIIKEGQKTYFVSPEIGTSILPVRFMTPPEVSFLKLGASK